MIEYDELRVRVLGIGRNRYLVLANGPAAAAAAVRIAPDNGFRESFGRLLDEEFRRAERTRPAVHERVRELGERLFATLFPGPLAACLFDSARRAERYGQRLRVRFELPPELSDLPIEILCPPPPDRRLVGDSRFSLTRTVAAKELAPGRLPTAKSQRERFRVLVVVASPRDDADRHRLPVLDTEAEVLALREALKGRRAAAVTMEILGRPSGGSRKNRPTFANLRAELDRHDEEPTAVVFLGHGIGGDSASTGQVFLENPDGSPDPVSGDRLAGLFASAPHVRLAVLNLCAGADRGTAAALSTVVADELIARGVPAVVAMQADVSDPAAARFTPTLFTKLAADLSLDEAVAVARQDLVNPRDETTLEWATPVLLLHQQCGHTWLFKTIVFVKGDIPVDPLAAGQQAMAEVDNPPNGVLRVEALATAARFARLSGDWRRAVRYAELGADEEDESLDWLAREGRLELAVDRCRTVCELLVAERDLGEVRAVLDGIRTALPGQVHSCLDGEIQLAARASAAQESARKAAETGNWTAVIDYCEEALADLPDGYGQIVSLREQATDELDLDGVYRRAGQNRDAGDWPAAVGDYAAIMARRPDGYRDADRWEQYCHGHVAETDHDYPAAIEAYTAVGGLADASGRADLCRARQAEDSGEWRVAVDGYEAAQRSGLDAGLALPYAVGRLAFAEGDFARAAKVLGGLPEPYRDAREHSHFAEGKVAFAAAEWDLVLDALHVLPPAFLADEVSRMRGLARANLATVRKDWRAAIEALQHVPEDDEVRVLRATARAYDAEERGDWLALVAAFDDTTQPTAELADLWTYARGRAAEADRRLADALAFYQDVSVSMRDAGARVKLVRGMIQEETGNWPEALRCFDALSADFENAIALRGYARVRIAFDREDWPAVVSEAGKLGTFRDAVALKGYGRARLAESAMDWPGAAGLFAACPGFRDSDDRLGYARGRFLAADGRWREALACYLPLPDDHGDVLARRARLTDLLESFGWAEGLGEAPAIPDPSAVAREDFPYRVLAPLGVGPATSMAQVKEAELRALQANEPGAIAVATLRSWERRLSVDADLYPIRDPARLRTALGALADGEPADLFKRLCLAAADDGPLLTLLHLGREQAITAWEERLRADPGEPAVVHCLAIAYRWAARDLDQAGAWEHAIVAWRQCIGMWVAVLGDDAYWERWRKDRSACYQFMVPVAEVTRLRRAVAAELTGELHRIAELHDQAGRSAMAGSYRMLGLAVQTEALGRDVLAELGGVSASGGARVIGGLVFLRAVGLSAGIGKLAAELSYRETAGAEEDSLELEADAVVFGELVTRLRAAFSRLAPAQVLLEAARPERALAALPGLPYMTLADVQAGSGCGCANPPGDRCPACGRFRAEDPAYAYLPGRDAHLWQDMVRIAVECHARIARDAVLGDDESGVDVAVREIGAILDSASAVGLDGWARGTVTDMVSACVEAMTARGNGRSLRPDRAVEVVVRLRDDLGLRGDELRRLQAKALFQRAQEITLNDDHGACDYDQAIADLRLAIELNPTMLMARVGLAHTLVDRFVDQPWLLGQVAAMAETLTGLDQGLRLAPEMGSLHEALFRAAGHVRTLVYATMTSDEIVTIEPPTDVPGESRTARAVRLARTAVKAAAAGDWRTALLLAVDAVEADPRSSFARSTLIDLVARWAGRDPDGSAP